MVVDNEKTGINKADSFMCVPVIRDKEPFKCARDGFLSRRNCWA